jgi:mRNA-degrading endonuclease RelE of RelBE toxin-antitoxin system
MIFAPDAARAIRGLRAHVRRAVMDAIEVHLRFEPEKTSRSRIKRLRGMTWPQYRLRVDEFRVFYDVNATTVDVVAVVAKSAAAEWLAAEGVPQ